MRPTLCHNLSLPGNCVAVRKRSLTCTNIATRGCVARSSQGVVATRCVALRSRLAYQASIPMTCMFLEHQGHCYAVTQEGETHARPNGATPAGAGTPVPLASACRLSGRNRATQPINTAAGLQEGSYADSAVARRRRRETAAPFSAMSGTIRGAFADDVVLYGRGDLSRKARARLIGELLKEGLLRSDRAGNTYSHGARLYPGRRGRNQE